MVRHGNLHGCTSCCPVDIGKCMVTTYFQALQHDSICQMNQHNSMGDFVVCSGWQVEA